jgi:signal transduction histidine kinase
MYSELLAHDMVPKEKRGTYLNVLCQQADRLNHLIDNVLTFARLERKAIHNARIELTVSELIESMRQSLEQRLSNSGFTLQWQLAEPIDSQFLQTDPAAVEQILANLIDNSVKYASNASEKTIQIRLTSQGKYLSIQVIDRGPGISSHQKRQLFRPFSRSAEQAAGSAPGVGLGLALCSRIAKSLGGELNCPASGVGCEMQLRLPLLPRRP